MKKFIVFGVLGLALAGCCGQVVTPPPAPEPEVVCQSLEDCPPTPTTAPSDACGVIGGGCRTCPEIPNPFDACLDD